MPTPCPVCNSELIRMKERPGGVDAFSFSCPLCGNFILSGTLFRILPNRLGSDMTARAKISHAIRTMQKSNVTPELHTNTIDEILKRPLPSPKEQIDLFVRWLAENVGGPGETVQVDHTTHSSIIGAKSPEGFALVIDYLFEQGLVTGHRTKASGHPGSALATLSIEGWEYYESLRRGGAIYHKAFMAMKFGNPDLDNIVEKVFKPCVLETGFKLFKLDDAPRAGLIDDRLRVEIQGADFLIADLTDDNPGAYWEAGYAEGLGKPVIYTCEKAKFEKNTTHFDTNHHLTIKWDKDSAENAGKRLKATIRATLPEIAKQEDS